MNVETRVGCCPQVGNDADESIAEGSAQSKCARLASHRDRSRSHQVIRHSLTPKEFSATAALLVGIELLETLFVCCTAVLRPLGLDR